MGNIIAAIAVLGALGALFGLILSVASKIFEVKKDPREEAILSHLAGANCGGCGYPGCGGCAAAILAGNAPVTACAPAGPDNAAAIAEIMGMAAPTGERQVAFVRCNGGEAAKKRFEYVGVQDCLSATKVAAGPLECRFGCLGFGSCVNACQFGAMSIGPNGTAVVDPEKCTNCGACMKACPRGLITSVPASKKVHVACANLDKGKAAMSVCGNSCIGCGLCEKECKKDAIHVVNGVAVVQADKCRACGLCVSSCPRHLISLVSEKQDVFVSCSSHDRGPVLRENCNIGCIGCTLCQKTCKHDAIHVVDNLASIDYDKCVNCGECVAVCPRKLIVRASSITSETRQSAL